MRNVGEVVTISIDGKPTVYGRIEGYEPDRKRGWYQVSLLLLTFPAQGVIWTLREEQIDGEAFSMEGIPVQIQPVPTTRTDPPSRATTPQHGSQPAAVISLTERAHRRDKKDA